MLWLAACSSRSTTLTVSAAASLTDAFTDIAAAFEADNPGLSVELNLAASGVLAQQVRQGVPVDVFASASSAVMDDLEAGGFLAAGTRQDIAGNQLVLIAPPDGVAIANQLELHTLEPIAVGNPELVPAGMYARESLQSLELWLMLESQLVYGESVRQVLAWVETGEVQAGLVYATDAQTSQRVQIVTQLPLESHEPISYPIAVLRDAHLPQAAAHFVDFVAGPPGQAILAQYGFAPPGEVVP